MAANTLVDSWGMPFEASSENLQISPPPPTPRSKMAQISDLVVPYDREMHWLPRNPDAIFQKRNAYEIYYEMLRDNQIKALTDIKKNLILGEGFDIEPPRDVDGDEIDDTQSQEIVEFIYSALNESYQGHFMHDLYNVLSAMSFGFSLHEIIWSIEDGQIIPSSLKNVPPDGIVFNIDKKGNFVNDAVTQRIWGGEQKIPFEKLIYFKWQGRSPNPYGESELRACYRPWFMKSQITNYWAIYLEKFGMPFTVAKYSEALRPQASSIQEIVNRIQSSANAVLPEDVNIEFHEVGKQNGDSFQMAIKEMDNQIAVAMGVPSLLGFSSEMGGKGSYALGKEQAKTFFATIRHYQSILEECINQQFIRRMVDLNFSNVEAYPQFKLRQLIKEDNLDKIAKFTDLLKTDTFKPAPEHIQYAIEQLGFPPADIQIKDPAPQQQSPFGMPPIQPTPAQEKPKPKAKTNIESEPKAPPKAKGAGSDNEPQDYPLSISVSASKKEGRAEGFDATPKTETMVAPAITAETSKLLADSIVNYKKVASTLDTSEESLVKKVSGLIIAERKQLIATLLAKRPLERDDTAFIQKYAPNKETIGKIRTVFERALAKMGKEGIADCREEIKKQLPEKYSLLSDLGLSQDQINAFLDKFSKTTAFKMAGDIGDQLKKSVQTILLEGLRLGKTTDEIVSDIRDAFTPFVEGGVLPSATAAPYRLENIVRTNMSTIYNQGRIAGGQAFIEDGTLAYWLFSAVMDDRTTDICAELNGTLLPADDPQLGDIQPPRHYNCRSIMVPISKYRQDLVDEGLALGEDDPSNPNAMHEGLDQPADFYDGF